MSLTQEQIEKLAEKLGKIRVNGEKMGQDINNILAYIDMLNEIDTEGVIPTVSVAEHDSVLRKDIVVGENNAQKELLACSKQQVISDQIAISNIMK